MARQNLFFRGFQIGANTEEELRAYFGQFGEIKSLRIVEKEGSSLGRGYVSFETVESA